MVLLQAQPPTTTNDVAVCAQPQTPVEIVQEIVNFLRDEHRLNLLEWPANNEVGRVRSTKVAMIYNSSADKVEYWVITNSPTGTREVNVLGCYVRILNTQVKRDLCSYDYVRNNPIGTERQCPFMGFDGTMKILDPYHPEGFDD